MKNTNKGLVFGNYTEIQERSRLFENGEPSRLLSESYFSLLEKLRSCPTTYGFGHILTIIGSGIEIAPQIYNDLAKEINPFDYIYLQNQANSGKKGLGLFIERFPGYVPQISYTKFETAEQLNGIFSNQNPNSAIGLHFQAKFKGFGEGLQILNAKPFSQVIYLHGDLSPWSFKTPAITITNEAILENGLKVLGSKLPIGTPQEVIERDLRLGLTYPDISGGTPLYRLNTNCIQYDYSNIAK
jgi:hypothetical protein